MKTWTASQLLVWWMLLIRDPPMLEKCQRETLMIRSIVPKESSAKIVRTLGSITGNYASVLLKYSLVEAVASTQLRSSIP